MQCPNCQRTWPEEYKGCPICMIPFGQAVARGQQAKAAAERSAVAEQIDGSVATGEQSIAAGANVVFAETGATVVIGEAPVRMTAVERESVLGRYLQHMVSRNRYLQLQGIRSGGRLVHIELDQIYVTLRATRQRVVEAEEAWLAQEAALAPGEGRRLDAGRTSTETVTVSVDEALAEYPRLAVLGDPGSGKTTLLRYLALLYARDLAEGSTLVRDRLGLDESGRLPVLLPLRQIGAYLRAHRAVEDGTEGHALLLDFLLRSLASERIELPAGFFDEWLAGGRATVLLDGLDEVADPGLRRRVSRLVEAFTRAYPECRYAVTSRIVGYAGAARLGEGYATTTIKDFTMADVERFLANWHRLVAAGQMGPGESAEAYAAGQTQQLLGAIRSNERIRELAINPLMLTVIAMVHRDRVKLPDRRAELYGEAVDVLLGKWEEAKGVQEMPILEGGVFDTGDRRLMLQSVALRMHEAEQKEVAAEDLRRWLGEIFYDVLGEQRATDRAVDRFLSVIEERTGLLVARGEGVYAFSHLTFQEYLAALAVAVREDYVAYTLARVPDPWWREVILLEAGYLSTQSKERTTHLIRAIASLKKEPELYHNLLLAADCLQNVGLSRVESAMWNEIRSRLRHDMDRDLQLPSTKLLAQLKARPLLRWPYDLIKAYLPEEVAKLVRHGIGVRGARRKAAATALARIGGAFWTESYGEPEWVYIPAGQFWMGTGENHIPDLLAVFGGMKELYMRETPLHRVNLSAFLIARVPITNSQYRAFVRETGHGPPAHWDGMRPPRGLESHPVVNVSWYDAVLYCEWLSKVTGRHITLPSEAEWEKAARGDKDQRVFPWGDIFDASRCNSLSLGLGSVTPVGIFPNGASPYGVLDMSGNVWEWTRSIYRGYPYSQGSERLGSEVEDDALLVLRGGGCYDIGGHIRCAFRGGIDRPPNHRGECSGFRVVAPVPSGL